MSILPLHRVYLGVQQLKVEATFKGVRVQTAIAFVNITVQRNENAPRFTKGDFRASIMENHPLGEEVLQVSATDKDAHVSYWRAVSLASSTGGLSTALVVSLVNW